MSQPSSPRRASRRITLVLIGSAAALAACAPDAPPTYQRDHYLSLQDCEADWGRPEACEPASGNALAANGGGGSASGGTGGGGGYYFRGPIYSTGYRNDAQTAWREMARADGRPVASLAPSDRSVARSGPASRPVASGSSTSRGGFGSSARSFSSGG